MKFFNINTGFSLFWICTINCKSWKLYSLFFSVQKRNHKIVHRFIIFYFRASNTNRVVTKPFQRLIDVLYSRYSLWLFLFLSQHLILWINISFESRFIYMYAPMCQITDVSALNVPFSRSFRFCFVKRDSIHWI